MRTLIATTLVIGLMLGCGQAEPAYEPPTPDKSAERVQAARVAATVEAQKRIESRAEKSRATAQVEAELPPTLTPFPTPRFNTSYKPPNNDPQWCDALNGRDRIGSPRQMIEGKVPAKVYDNPRYDHVYIVGYNELLTKMIRGELLVNVRGGYLADDIRKRNRLLGFLHQMGAVRRNAFDYSDDALTNMRSDVLAYVRENLAYGSDGDVNFRPRDGLVIRHDERWITERDDDWGAAQETLRAKIRGLHPHMAQLVDRAKTLCPQTLRTLKLVELPTTRLP